MDANGSELNRNGTHQAEHVPLAERFRPETWAAFQHEGIRERAILERLREGRGSVPSLILWGPPGVGKTSLARLVGSTFPVTFVELSAVLSGVKEVRAVVDAAQHQHQQRQTVLFLDEIHRFNKAQQDAFLPHIERGTIALIGATTENPSFYLTSALLSRVRVIQLNPLPKQALSTILDRALRDASISCTDEIREIVLEAAEGDARSLLSMVEELSGVEVPLERDALLERFSRYRMIRHDRAGDSHYDIASAFIKSLRGSHPDAALYWGFRMLEAGDDPAFVIRRMIIFASEDIGNADPRALQLAVATAEAYDRIGFPEARIPIAQCITYLATAPKSNRSYLAMHGAIKAIRNFPRASVPLHLRNAPTNIMQEAGYGEGYLYPHDLNGAVDATSNFLPEEISALTLYEPSDRGYELRIQERMNQLKALRNH
jgi:putative ATPase